MVPKCHSSFPRSGFAARKRGKGERERESAVAQDLRDVTAKIRAIELFNPRLPPPSSLPGPLALSFVTPPLFAPSRSICHPPPGPSSPYTPWTEHREGVASPLARRVS